MKGLQSFALLIACLPLRAAAEPNSAPGYILQGSGRSKILAQEESACRKALEMAGSAKSADAPNLSVCQQFLLKQKGDAANQLRWEVAKALLKLERYAEATSVLEAIHDESQEGSRQKILGISDGRRHPMLRTSHFA